MNYLKFSTQKNNYIFNPIDGHIYKYDNDNSVNESSIIKGIISGENVIEEVTIGYSFAEIKEAIDKNLKQMTLCVTQNCNLRCNYCVYSGQFKNFRTHKNIYMSNRLAIDAANYFIDHASSADNLYFTFYGGEPFLNFPLILATTKYLKSKLNERVNISITTNGTLINKEIINFIKEYKVFLSISLDGDQQTHDKHRKFINGKGTHEKIMRNIKNLKTDLGELFHTHISFTATLSAECDYKELDLFFINFRNSVRVSGVQFYGSDSIAPIAGNSKNMSYMIDKFTKGILAHMFDDDHTKEPYRFPASVVGRGIKSIHLRNVADKQIYDKTFPLKKHCIPGATKLFVAPNGDLFPCEKLDCYKHLKIGNIYSNIDYTRVYQYLMEYVLLRNKFCKDCFLIDICDQCFLSASDGERWDEEKMKFYCNNARNEYKKAFSIYVGILEKDANAFDYIDKEMDISQ